MAILFGFRFCELSDISVFLLCVFHGIRFKVNKVGCRETTDLFYFYTNQNLSVHPIFNQQRLSTIFKNMHTSLKKAATN